MIRTRDGVHLRVEDRGSGGPPLLLLHGFTGSLEAWGGELLDRLAAARRVVAVDLVGHGESDAPDDPARYRLGAVLDDLGDVLDALEVERAVWLGYSMGGRVALAAGVLRPERVAGLVLESASPGLADAGDRARRRARDAQLADRIEREAERTGGIESFVDDWLALPLFASRASLSAATRERERRRRLRGDPRGLANALRGLGTGSQPSFWDRLDEVCAPALLLTGELDRKFEAIAGRMAERMPDAVRATVPGAGHTVHLERPDPWADAVEGFCRRVAGGPAKPNGARATE